MHINYYSSALLLSCMPDNKCGSNILELLETKWQKTYTYNFFQIHVNIFQNVLLRGAAKAPCDPDSLNEAHSSNQSENFKISYLIITFLNILTFCNFITTTT